MGSKRGREEAVEKEARFTNKQLELDSSVMEGHHQSILNAVLEARRPSQNLLRLEIRTLRRELEYSRTHRQDPKQQLPLEIWHIILDNTETADLANCTKTCLLFKSLIDYSNQEVLFEKVLPFLFPYLETQNIKTLKTLARVCTQWQVGVQSFANSLFQAPQPAILGVENLSKEPTKTLSELQMSWCELDSELYLKTNSVELGDDNDSWETEDRQDQQEECPVIFPKISSVSISEGLLPTLLLQGHLVGSLSLLIDAEMENVPTIISVCAKILKTCPTLRKFILGEAKNKLAPTSTQNALAVNIPQHSKLETLEITTKSSELAPLVDQLLIPLSAQLKQVKIPFWNARLYHSLPWENLIELQIMKSDNTAILLVLLANTKAPHLRKLGIPLDFKYLDLHLIFKCVNNFSNLQNLRVFASDNFNRINHHKMFLIPLELLSVNRITTLEVFCKTLNEVRDIAALFPLVKYLSYHYVNLCVDPQVSLPVLEDDSITRTHNGFKTNHIIQICKDMNKSNIWKLLPQLQTLRMSNSKNLKETRKHNREAFLWETSKYNLGCEIQLGKVRQVVSNLEKRKLLEQKQQISLQSQRKFCTEKVMKPCNQILPFILPMLSSSDIMSCRHVSRAWSKLIDDQRLPNYRRTPLYKFKVDYPTKSVRLKLSAYVDKHKNEAFFARRVKFSLIRSYGNLDGVRLLMRVLGKHIYHLILTTGGSVVPELGDIYRICVECLNHCPNLRSFSFQIPVLTRTSDSDYEEIKAKYQLSAPINLEELLTCGPDQQIGTPLNTIVKDLEVAFHSNLRAITQPRCSTLGEDDVAEFKWLKEYTITNFAPTTAYMNPNFKNLEKLRLFINTHGMTMQHFRDLAKQYPNLKELELQFGPSFYGLDHNLVYCDPEIIMPVSSVKLVMRDKYQVSLDFLIHFPYVRNLSISYGKYALHVGREQQQEGVNNFSKTSIGLNRIRVRESKRDFIQLMSYLKNNDVAEHNAAQIQTSIIWRVFRRLQTIEVMHHDHAGRPESTVFCRK